MLLWQRYDNNEMAAMRYYGNVMITTRWWLCVTILHLQQYSHRLNLFKFFSGKSGHSCLLQAASSTFVVVWIFCSVI